jgi:hypothetical protein
MNKNIHVSEEGKHEKKLKIGNYLYTATLRKCKGKVKMGKVKK